MKSMNKIHISPICAFCKIYFTKSKFFGQNRFCKNMFYWKIYFIDCSLFRQFEIWPARRTLSARCSSTIIRIVTIFTIISWMATTFSVSITVSIIIITGWGFRQIGPLLSTPVKWAPHFSEPHIFRKDPICHTGKIWNIVVANQVFWKLGPDKWG